ncbi:MAG: hypothetical protein AAGC46_17120, partial [Solirubrobacteraceae bacterium]
NQSGAGGGPGTGAAGITFSVPSKFKSPATKGVPFTVRGAAGPIQITATTGKTVITKRTVKVGASGSAAVTLKLGKALVAKLKSKHHLTIQVTATQGAASAVTSFRI